MLHHLSLKTYASQARRITWSNGTQETKQRVAVNPALKIIVSFAAFHELAYSFPEVVAPNLLERGFLGLAVNKVALVAYSKYRSKGLNTVRYLGEGEGVMPIENCGAFYPKLLIDSKASCVDRLPV
jgi:hypothetical protein